MGWKVLIFGTGDYYKKYRKWMTGVQIVALVDNDSKKIGTFLDGSLIVSPMKAVTMEFDKVILLSVYIQEMTNQLLELSVEKEKIIPYSQLHQYPEICSKRMDVHFHGTQEAFSSLMQRSSSNTILCMSHNLDLNGASLALFYLAQVLKKKGHQVLFVSWNDGKLKEYLYKEEIPVLIDSNLELYTEREIPWLVQFDFYICNTINYIHFLANRNLEKKIVWWLHDPEMFYQPSEISLLQRMDGKNLRICAVGKQSAQAMKKYRSDFLIEPLLYGFPDVEGAITRSQKEKGEKLRFTVIATLQKYKGQDLVLDALASLTQEERDKIQITFVGEQNSQFASSLKDMANKYTDCVLFRDPMNRENIQRLLQETDVYICPSRVDTMSISTTEAIAQKIPCIVSDAAGIAEYFTDGVDGFLFESGNAKMLAEKLKECIHHPERLPWIGEKGRKIYERYFSMDVFEKEVEKMRFFGGRMEG
jgi:glycosyltransferase involved in cell wall biosynthesis